MDINSACERQEPHRAFATHLAALPGKVLAAAIGVDESTASRVKSGEAKLTAAQFETLLAIPSAAFPRGLTVGPRDGLFVGWDELRALRTLAGRYLDAVEAREQRP